MTDPSRNLSPLLPHDRWLMQPVPAWTKVDNLITLLWIGLNKRSLRNRYFPEMTSSFCNEQLLLTKHVSERSHDPPTTTTPDTFCSVFCSYGQSYKNGLQAAFQPDAVTGCSITLLRRVQTVNTLNTRTLHTYSDKHRRASQETRDKPRTPQVPVSVST